MANGATGGSTGMTVPSNGLFSIAIDLVPGRNGLTVNESAGGNNYEGFVGNALDFDATCVECVVGARLDVVLVPPVE